MLARHAFENWVRDPETMSVGIIQEDLPSKFKLFPRVAVQWQDGKVTEGPFCYDLITEYEYFKVVNPKRCGADILELIAAMHVEAQEDWFTGGLWRRTIVKTKEEDLFA